MSERRRHGKDIDVLDAIDTSPRALQADEMAALPGACKENEDPI